MAGQVRVTVLGGFSLSVPGESACYDVNRSKKGMLLLQVLILEHEAPVSSQRLISLLWPDGKSQNPENALKTLISRFRVLLNERRDRLGRCIVASRGGYQFRLLDDMTVDLIAFERLYERLSEPMEWSDEQESLVQEALRLYSGNPVCPFPDDERLVRCCNAKREQYLDLVHHYLQFLTEKQQYGEVIEVCRFALEIDPLDEYLHLNLMQALVKSNRSNEALGQYKHVASLHFRYLGVQPPKSIQQYYQQLVSDGDELDTSIESVRQDLRRYSQAHGAYECDYSVFQEIFNLELRNLDRTGSALFLAMVMISTVRSDRPDPMRVAEIMTQLGELLKQQLRKGDVIAHYAPTQYVLLLPMSDQEGGKRVLERIKRCFYQRCADSNFIFSYRISPLTDEETPMLPSDKK